MNNNKNWYIIPLNESTGLKELRVSRRPHSYSQDGPRSGARIDGVPIEDVIFKSMEEAYKAIPVEFYP